MRYRIVQPSLLASFACASLLMLGPLVGAQTVSPPPPSPALAQGFGLLRQGDAAGAIRILEPLIAAEPHNVRALRVLGAALLQAGKYDRAAEVIAASLAIEPAFPSALYNMGAARARQGKADEAFEWLRKAKNSGGLDMTFVQTDPDLASIVNDPRMLALIPSAEELKSPFVEPTKIIREWDGESAGDQFGWIARDIGDVDGDGVRDIVTSAPTHGANNSASGRVYVYSTKSGRLLWSADGEAGDHLGNGIEAAGDVNHDGIPDVVAGAPIGGKAFVYSGRDGKVLLALKAENKGDSFGQHVAGVGDVNRDGYADLIVGAPANSAGGKDAGRAYLYSGKDGKLLHTYTGERAGDALGSTVGGYRGKKGTFILLGAPAAGPRKTGRTYVYKSLAATPDFVIDSDESGAALGAMFISAVGDIDGDGVPDIYASDFTNSAKGPSTGRIYVHSGKSGKRLMTLSGEIAGEGFGIGAASAGDVDHDGHDDLVVGAWQFAGAAPSGGKIYLYSGKDGHLIRGWTGKIMGETLGFDAVGIGDVDGDGTVDLLVTSAWSTVHGYHSGRMYIISSGGR